MLIFTNFIQLDMSVKTNLFNELEETLETSAILCLTGDDAKTHVKTYVKVLFLMISYIPVKLFRRVMQHFRHFSPVL